MRDASPGSRRVLSLDDGARRGIPVRAGCREDRVVDSEGEKAVLRRAASVAHFSTHPLARAIVAEAGKRNLPIN